MAVPTRGVSFMVNGTREGRSSPTKIQTTGSGPHTDSTPSRLSLPDETWSPRSIKAAYTAQAVKALLIDEIIPSYPSVNSAFQRMNVFGENAIRRSALQSALERWSVRMNPEEFELLWQDLPKDADGRFGLVELKLFLRRPGSVTSTSGSKSTSPQGDSDSSESDGNTVASLVASKVLQRFGSFDRAAESLMLDDDGDFSSSQLKIFLKTCNCSLSELELKEFTAALDKRGTGNIHGTAMFDKLKKAPRGPQPSPPGYLKTRITSAGTASTSASNHTAAGSSVHSTHANVAGTVLDAESVFTESDGEADTSDDEDKLENSDELELTAFDSRKIGDSAIAASVSPKRLSVETSAPLVAVPEGGDIPSVPSTHKYQRIASRFRARPPATFISQAEFKRVLAGLGVQLEGSEADVIWYAFLRRFDTADDGRVNSSEFWAVVADLFSPGVCHSLNLTFTIVPSGGHPKSRWHSAIEAVLTQGVTKMLQRLEASFRVCDKSNSGFISKPMAAACVEASGIDFGPDVSEFLSDGGAGAMLSFDELKSLLVSFMVQFYPPSPPVPSTFPAIPSAECCPPDVVVKLVSNWHAFRRVLRAFDVDGVGTIPRIQLQGLLGSFGVSHDAARNLLDAFCDPASKESEAVINYTSLCDHVVQRSDGLFSNRPTTAGGPRSRVAVSTKPQKPSTGSVTSQDTFFSGIVVPAEISEVYSAVFGQGIRRQRVPRQKLTPSDLVKYLSPMIESDFQVDPVKHDESAAPALVLPPIASSPSDHQPIKSSVEAHPAVSASSTASSTSVSAVPSSVPSGGTPTSSLAPKPPLAAPTKPTIAHKPAQTAVPPSSATKPATNHRKIVASPPHQAGGKK